MQILVSQVEPGQYVWRNQNPLTVTTQTKAKIGFKIEEVRRILKLEKKTQFFLESCLTWVPSCIAA